MSDMNLNVSDFCVGYPGSIHDDSFLEVRRSPSTGNITERISSWTVRTSTHQKADNTVQAEKTGSRKEAVQQAYSTVRVSVETASGVIVTRWRRLLGIHLLSMSFMCKLCAAAITLHINCNEADGFFDVAEDLHFEAVSQKAADASAISL